MEVMLSNFLRTSLFRISFRSNAVKSSVITAANCYINLQQNRGGKINVTVQSETNTKFLD